MQLNRVIPDSQSYRGLGQLHRDLRTEAHPILVLRCGTELLIRRSEGKGDTDAARLHVCLLVRLYSASFQRQPYLIFQRERLTWAEPGRSHHLLSFSLMSLNQALLWFPELTQKN